MENKIKETAKPFSKTLHMGGIPITLPVQPYQSQIQLMSKVIKGLEKKEHCLLESPTGSGKSLALLCSTLAWQKAKQNQALQQPNVDLSKETANPAEDELKCTCKKTNAKIVLFESCENTAQDDTKKKKDVIDLTTDSSEEDFQQTTSSKKKKKKKKRKSLVEELDKVTEHQELCAACIAKKNKVVDDVPCNSKPLENFKIPKIWYGTRTHKQITQIVHELGRTAYKNVNMTILSSREHSCIHPINKKSNNKNEDCKDWRDGTHAAMPGSQCAYHMNASRLRSHEHLYSCGLTSAWDIEDLVSLGENVKSCPYYASRELIATADIIFCPYNYLIDPNLRDVLKVNINRQVVIMDEAHNIEDSARDAASFSLTETDLANATTDLGILISQEVKLDDHKPLYLLCTRVGQWLTGHCKNLVTNEYESSSTVWTGHDFLAHMAEWGITQDTMPLILKNMENAKSTEDVDFEYSSHDEERKKPPSMKSNTIHVLGGLFHVLSYLMRYDNIYCEDYRITIIKQSQYGIVPPKRTADGWVSLSKKPKKHFVTTLNFWCLNPAVAFGDLSKAHSIILTSGTLSPMSSFASELGTQFPIQLEANHVIKDSQVWVGCLGEGPHGVKLQATYRNTESFSFQDELGECILHVCQTVPNGVLCFFSSYSLLNKLQDRWQNTGLWYRLNEHKYVVSEPRKRGKTDFENIMNEFYDNVNGVEGQLTGALMLAVCRGKISEGLDFADSNARAVITVGIPFPNFMDKQVKLKRSYNDKHKLARGLLSGAEWYDIQAFRAMNQALGRCIRHKNDWGALLVVDERFVKNSTKYCKGLSKWVRNKACTHYNFSSAMSSLKDFIDVQMFEMQNKDELEEVMDTTSSFSVAMKRRKESDDENPQQSKTMVMDTTAEPETNVLHHNSILTQDEDEPTSMLEETKVFPNVTVELTTSDTPLKPINNNNINLTKKYKNTPTDKVDSMIVINRFLSSRKISSSFQSKHNSSSCNDDASNCCCKEPINSLINKSAVAENKKESPMKAKEKEGSNSFVEVTSTDIPQTYEEEEGSPSKVEVPLIIPESPCEEYSMKFEHNEDEPAAKKKLFHKNEDQASEGAVYCRHCTLIFKLDQAGSNRRVRAKFRSVYLQEKLNTNDSLFELEFINFVEKHENLALTVSKHDVMLNAVWSEADNQCYKMYKCLMCGKFAAIRIVSNHNLRRKILLLD